ncbi:hypothetical protein M3Y95_01030000 [Aphelenchoides besseyi]|nr:hypothetical protein M3Y95_01030000 [Aphelenchoides besseyi]
MSELNLHARAILLEQFNDGAVVGKAMERVIEEVGSNGITDEEALELYQQFGSGNTNIVNSTSKTNELLIEDGVYLKFKRAIAHQSSHAEWTYFCRTKGIDKRFQFFYYTCKCRTSVVDTFSGLTKEIIDSDDDWQRLENICLLENEVIVGTISRGGKFLSTGTLDLIEGRLKLEKTAKLDVQYEHRLFVSDRISLLERLETETSYSTIDMCNGKLERSKTLLFSEKLSFPFVRNDRLYGFLSGSPVNTTKLIEFSLSDETKLEFQIELRDQLDVRLDHNCAYIWINDKLLVSHYEGNGICALVEFDFSELKWQKTNIVVRGDIELLSVHDNTLLVYTCGLGKSAQYESTVLHFSLSKVDSLTNLIWGATKRYSVYNPQFNRWFLSKLSLTSKHQPLW